MYILFEIKNGPKRNKHTNSPPIWKQRKIFVNVWGKMFVMHRICLLNTHIYKAKGNDVY